MSHEIKLPDDPPGNYHLYPFSVGYGRQFGSGTYPSWEHHLRARLVPVGRSAKRRKVEIEMRSEEEYVTWKSWDDVKATIDELTKGMPEGSWQIELTNVDRSYDEGTYGALVATCFREPTDEEFEIVRGFLENERAEAERVQRERDEHLIEELRRRRPDLLPTTFVDP
jgi:uncharacterized protein with von Willebrand factor type A (vWA) domain